MVHYCRFENLSISTSSHENSTSKTHVIYVESLFTNIRKQYNMVKISLLFRKFANFTCKQLDNS